MEAQLKAMRVPELKELATKAGLNVAAKLTKDKIIALLLESPNTASLLDGAPTNGAPAAPSSDEPAPASAPAPTVKPAPAKGSIDDLLAPPPEFDWSAGAPAPTVGAQPTSTTEPAHVAKPVEVHDPTPAASNALGPTTTSAPATSGAPKTEPTTSVPIPEVPINPLDGSSKPVAGIVKLAEDEKRAARKARFEREWQLDQVRKQAEAAAKSVAKEVVPKKVADAAKQLPTAPAAPKVQPATKTNGSTAVGLSSEILEKRKARFAQAGDQTKPPTAPAAAPPAPPAAPVLTGVDAEKAAVRKNKFNSLLPGQPGYHDPTKEAEASPKRKREEEDAAPPAKKAKSDEVTA
ncbi:hypothetical protein CALVIDRAFT_564681 [Calocera viscosa TUFC12733]|uniref:Uncharacterized protein n=1 Tax=Calocera viscosa (strain TUFC12733) TaxID=1330018 RepID=A0A167LFR3_CALVF|nr:hypothetical protein CALVIDRAFT_564681 [Calocera viscosa TUFC12733]